MADKVKTHGDCYWWRSFDGRCQAPVPMWVRADNSDGVVNGNDDAVKCEMYRKRWVEGGGERS